MLIQDLLKKHRRLIKMLTGDSELAALEPQIKLWHHVYDLCCEREKPEEFEYFHAMRAVASTFPEGEQAWLSRLRKQPEFIAFFQLYHEEIMEAHELRLRALEELDNSPQRRFAEQCLAEVRRILEDAPEASPPDPKYGYLIARSYGAVYEELGGYEPLERELPEMVLEQAGALLREEGATREDQSRYFSERSLAITRDARLFLTDRPLPYGSALGEGITTRTLTSVVILAVEHFKSLAEKYPEDAEELVQFLTKRHPRTDDIRAFCIREGVEIDSMETWLRTRKAHPTLFSVAEGTGDCVKYRK